MLIIGKGSIEEKVKQEKVIRSEARRQEDIMKGLTRPKCGQRGDYKLCNQLDRVLADYKRFKSPADREKIKKEYYGIQREGRRAV